MYKRANGCKKMLLVECGARVDISSEVPWATPCVVGFAIPTCEFSVRNHRLWYWLGIFSPPVA
jgi:hypothetical protein